MIKATVLIASLLLPVLSQAGTIEDLNKIKSAEVACQDKANSNVEMKECEWVAYADADALLNKQYKAIVAPLKLKSGDVDSDKYNAETLARLIKSERAWITFRDAECDLQGTSMLGGSGEGLIIGGCVFSETAKRVESLEALFGSSN